MYFNFYSFLVSELVFVYISACVPVCVLCYIGFFRLRFRLSETGLTGKYITSYFSDNGSNLHITEAAAGGVL